MYELISEQDGHALGIHFRGDVSPNDLDALSAFLDERLSATDQLSLLFEFDGLSRAVVPDVVEHLTLRKSGPGTLDRVAVVGDEMWVRWCDELQKHLPQTEVQFYGGSTLAQAWAWVRKKV